MVWTFAAVSQCSRRKNFYLIDWTFGVRTLNVWETNVNENTVPYIISLLQQYKFPHFWANKITKWSANIAVSVLSGHQKNMLYSKYIYILAVYWIWLYYTECFALFYPGIGLSHSYWIMYSTYCIYIWSIFLLQYFTSTLLPLTPFWKIICLPPLRQEFKCSDKAITMIFCAQIFLAFSFWAPKVIYAAVHSNA